MTKIINHPDDELIVAEVELSLARSEKRYEDADRVEERIYALEPKSWIGGAVKLRLLCDPDIGMEIAEPSEAQMGALRQVLKLAQEDEKQQLLLLAADSAIGDAFRRWMEVIKAENEPSDDDIPDELSQAESDLADEIADMPVSGPVGFALKTYVATYYVGGVGISEKLARDGGDPCSFRCFDPGHYGTGGRLYFGNRLFRGLLTDAARFAPELEPLARDVINSPIVLPSDDGCVA